MNIKSKLIKLKEKLIDEIINKLPVVIYSFAMASLVFFCFNTVEKINNIEKTITHIEQILEKR